MRKFNTAGPVRAARHYLIPPLERLNLAEVLTLIGDERYLVLHAPEADREDIDPGGVARPAERRVGG